VNSLADISYFENPEFYDKLQRAHNVSVYRPLNVMHGVVQIFRSLVQLVSMVTVLLVFQPMLVLVAVAMAVPSLVQQLKSQVQMWEITSWSVPEVRRMRYFAELISGKDSAKEVRLYGLGNYFLDRFQREFDAFHSRFRALRQRHCRWEMGTALVGELGSSAMFFWLVLQALARRVTLGDLSLYSQAVWQTNGLIGGLVRQLSSLYAEILFVGQLFEFLETPPAMLTAPAESAHRAPQPLQEGIALRDVTFRYPGSDRPVLEKLNLSIAPGESVALVGENGAGKTTIVKLLTRLYDPDEGQILVDGVDLKDHDLDDWRRQTAAIFQDFCKYHLSARENIGLGDLRRLNEQSAILHAAARGGAGSVVEKLPDGYETILGRWLFHSNSDRVDEGSELSGGEWQKVALSRGFMRSDGAPGPDGHGGAQLLMLDEPTAALDTQSEYDVYLRFSELTRGKATLLISHRFSTVKMADRIVVLEHGRIIEEGTHTELVSLGGVYADLYEKQASRYR